MPVPYIMIQQKSPPDARGHQKTIHYPRSVYRIRTDLDEMARWISKRCTVNPADVVAVLYALGDELQHRLPDGEKVSLPGLGDFSISIRSGDIDPGKRIKLKDLKGVKVVFDPDPKLKRSLRNLTFVPSKKQKLPIETGDHSG